jgi:hypothetical protein
MDLGEADARPPAAGALQGPGVVPDGQRGPDGTLGVVLVRGGDAEDGHEPVPHHLGHGAAVLLHEPLHGGQAGPDHGVDLLGVERGGQRGEAREVGEHQRDQLALAARDGAHGRVDRHGRRDVWA